MIVYHTLFLCALFLTQCHSKPGTPQIRWATHKYSLVEVNEQAQSYNSLVKTVYESVPVSLEWDVWSGARGDSVHLVWDGQVVKEGSSDELREQKIVYNVRKGGRSSVAVRLCDGEGCSDSVPVEVVVADTDGSHLGRLEYEWRENNVPYQRAPENGVVAAYFVEWGVYGRQFPADKVPVPNLSHLLYGFVPICGGDGLNDALKQVPGSFEALQRSCAGRDDFKVSIHDLWGAVQKPQKGVEAYDEPYKGNFGQLMAIKHHNPNLTILPSIGGWTLSDPFYKMHDSAKRRVFVQSVREFLETWKFFDGVDIDWEFPGGKGANDKLGDADTDKYTYVQLLSDLRQMLDELEEKTGRRLQLTSAISGGYDKIDVVDYKQCQQYLDYIFVMNYDYKGAWSMTDLGYHAPLYPPSWKTHENYTTDFALRRLLNQSVNSGKLVVGVAMYGRGWSGVTNYTNNNLFSGVATGKVKGTWEDGVVDYREIGAASTYTKAYDHSSHAAYAYRKTAERVYDLVTYDSVKSVLAKGEYVREHGLGGLFAWEIDADNGDLLNAMNEGLGNRRKSDEMVVLGSGNFKNYFCPFKNAIIYAINSVCNSV
uniref:Chitinase n=1 Tax=Cydia pomonella granulosis virus TaxID=28289 RepID=A0A097P247_GVCP|nr:ORF10 chitinase [Cydia pomonella granulovirus]QGY99836.1 chitinase [Cydia pomonella granulovirus]